MRVDTSHGQHPIGAKVAANADIRGTFPEPTAAAGTTMHGKCNATADVDAAVAQDMNGEHQKRKHTTIPINDSFRDNAQPRKKSKSRNCGRSNKEDETNNDEKKV